MYCLDYGSRNGHVMIISSILVQLGTAKNIVPFAFQMPIVSNLPVINNFCSFITSFVGNTTNLFISHLTHRWIFYEFHSFGVKKIYLHCRSIHLRCSSYNCMNVTNLKQNIIFITPNIVCGIQSTRTLFSLSVFVNWMIYSKIDGVYVSSRTNECHRNCVIFLCHLWK